MNFTEYDQINTYVKIIIVKIYLQLFDYNKNFIQHVCMK